MRELIATYASPAVAETERIFATAERLNDKVSCELVTRAEYFRQWEMLEDNMRTLMTVQM